MKIDHIGIAVDNLELAQKKIGDLFQCTFSPATTVDSQAVKVSFAELDNCDIELIEATSPKSSTFPMLPHPIFTFLQKNGWGLHHLSISVSDLQATLEQLDTLGIKPLDEQPAKGADGLVAFLNPIFFNGLLIELSEK